MFDEKNINYLKNKSNFVRNKVLDMIISANKGHIGGAFSCTDIIVSIYYSGLFNFNSNLKENEERDRFILSKGHSCVALYVVLADLGYFPISELDTFCKNNTRLEGHPDTNIPGIDATTGSLGQGLSIGIGMSLSSKLDNKKFRTIVLMGDCECHEGSVWESVMFAGYHKLNNLIAIIDHNKQCATDFEEDVIAASYIENRWKSFGWNVITLDGHSFPELINCFETLQKNTIQKQTKPTVIIAETIKGKGVSFMEKELIYHHTVPKGDKINIAKKELSEHSEFKVG